ncbi:protein FAM124A isoform X2 [Thalassophryne amazonica]|uniref:protein FAM124A isoform X2 n=1 Tax=Thalassophryne amazonica TaxID=390379 RepID=UPI001471F3D9|nr:protein FAM124A isoform X2 [Thalassophryne amazonica]
MKRSSAEDDCVDSGAETGSDHSPLSSASSELSMGELQDPFLVSVHLIADPGQARFLQLAVNGVLSWVHPELHLFRVSERASTFQRSRAKWRQNSDANCQAAMAVILFLQEASGGEEKLLTLHRVFQRSPWCYHHTEKVSNGRHMLPLTPCSQDFYTLSPGTPLWAVRQVHYGKEIVRFTVYCCHENYMDMVRLYKLLLQRKVAQKKEDFCFFVVYSNPDVEIQLSFKRLPRGQSPVTMDSAVMEVRVRDVGALVPLLPHACSPISDLRWQTEDYDGNKILLQIQAAHYKHKKDALYISLSSESSSAPSTFARSSASYKNRRYHRGASRPRVEHQASRTSLPLACEEQEEQDTWADPRHPEGCRIQCRNHRSGSLFSLPNLGSASSRSTCSSPGVSPTPHRGNHSFTRSSFLIPPFRLNVDALIGAEETDIDTGNKVNVSSSVDLTVVSAYIKSSLPLTPRPSSAPPEDLGCSFSSDVPEGAYKTSTLGRIPFSGGMTTSTSLRSCPQSTCQTTNAGRSLNDVSVSQSVNSHSVGSALVEKRSYQTDMAEEVQEFYI